MAENECVFCKMVTGQVPVTKIYEDDDVLAFMDIGPISDGHTLVISKKHFARLHDCPPGIIAKTASPIGKIAKAVTEATNAQGYNVLCNNGKVAGQLVNHVHFHIIPRHTEDKLFASWPSYQYEKGKAEKIAGKIKANL